MPSRRVLNLHMQVGILSPASQVPSKRAFANQENMDSLVSCVGTKLAAARTSQGIFYVFIIAYSYAEANRIIRRKTIILLSFKLSVPGATPTHRNTYLSNRAQKETPSKLRVPKSGYALSDRISFRLGQHRVLVQKPAVSGLNQTQYRF